MLGGLSLALNVSAFSKNRRFSGQASSDNRPLPATSDLSRSERVRGQTFHSLFRFLACAVVCYTQEDWVSSPSTQWHRKDAMPKSSSHVCMWSAKHQRYELQSHGH